MRRRVVKRPDRAAEKALACYDGDVSRLLDVCRARLVFDGVGGLAACLRAIRAGPASGPPEAEVEVVRVKNWMREDHDQWSTMGFRVGRARRAQGARRARGAGSALGPSRHTEKALSLGAPKGLDVLAAFGVCAADPTRRA